MPQTATVTQNVITLKGSTDIVTQFFGYSINNILYQRGVYPPETFSRVKKYGLAMQVTQDEGLKAYLSNVLMQLKEWLLQGKVQKLVLVIEGLETKSTLERWQFNIEHDKKKTITGEIQAIIRQITASVTFLPLLEEPCSFDLLVYADREANVPVEWEESDPKYISDATDVKLRSFTTKVHTVSSMVTYKN
eukprot:GSMAST32.ASY1.ANO1.1602.1 assembled CDS